MLTQWRLIFIIFFNFYGFVKGFLSLPILYISIGATNQPKKWLFESEKRFFTEP